MMNSILKKITLIAIFLTFFAGIIIDQNQNLDAFTNSKTPNFMILIYAYATKKQHRLGIHIKYNLYYLDISF